MFLSKCFIAFIFLELLLDFYSNTRIFFINFFNQNLHITETYEIIAWKCSKERCQKYGRIIKGLNITALASAYALTLDSPSLPISQPALYNCINPDFYHKRGHLYRMLKFCLLCLLVIKRRHEKFKIEWISGIVFFRPQISANIQTNYADW